MRKLSLVGLLLSGCDQRGPAELYRDALAAPTWDEARGLCERLPEADVPDCLVAAMEVQGRLDEADCDVLPKGVWHDECVFLYAEREARAGNLAEAFTACDRTVFGRECSYHLIREGARAVLDRTLEEASPAAVPYTGLDRAPDAQRLFWRTWFRERMEKKVPVDPTGCPTRDCLDGARETVLLTLNALARAGGAGFCEGPPPDGQSGARVLWVEGPETIGWVTEFVEGECARRQGRARGPQGASAGKGNGVAPGGGRPPQAGQGPQAGPPPKAAQRPPG
ncbi:MAG: proline-rich domain-containing protein [Pseudomonadota bacterium]|nr:proline-rich domain-containing protein [Pseudomonadota bacterium]